MGNENSTASQTPNYSVPYVLTTPDTIEQNGFKLKPLNCNLADPYNPDSIKIRQPITELNVVFNWKYEIPGVEIIDYQIRVHLWEGLVRNGLHIQTYTINRPGKYDQFGERVHDISADSVPLRKIIILGKGCEQYWDTSKCHSDEIILYLPSITMETIRQPLYAFKIAPRQNE